MHCAQGKGQNKFDVEPLLFGLYDFPNWAAEIDYVADTIGRQH